MQLSFVLSQLEYARNGHEREAGTAGPTQMLGFQVDIGD